MKKHYAVVVMATIMLLLTGCTDPSEIYDKGYNEGYNEGYSAGYEYGYDDGIFNEYADRRDYEDVFAEYLFAEDLIKLVIDYCDDPVEYIAVDYAPYWGEFTKVYGDICFGTIPDDLRHLIHYPPFDPSRVFVVEGGRSYHAKPYCYTLLRTSWEDIVLTTLHDVDNAGYTPCSKCIR